MAIIIIVNDNCWPVYTISVMSNNSWHPWVTYVQQKGLLRA